MKNKILITSVILASFILGGCDQLPFDPISPSSSQNSSETSSGQSESSSEHSHGSSSSSSSSQDQHTHTFSDEWAYDDNQHWHPSTCGHDVKDSVGNHRFQNISATDDGYVDECIVCGYQRTRPHNFSSSWSTDSIYHWHACLDEGFDYLMKDYGAHNFELYNEDDNGYDYRCTVCNRTGHTNHHFETAWSTSATHHWHACTDEGYTDLKANYGEHTFSSERDGDYMVYTCSVCGHSYQEIYEESPIASSKTMTTYLSLTSSFDSTVYFMRQYPDIPYVIFKDFYVPHYVDTCWGTSDSMHNVFALSQTKVSNGVYQFDNTPGRVTIDTVNDTMVTPGDAFRMMIATNMSGSVSTLSNGGETKYCKINTSSTIMNRSRGDIVIDCGAHNIDLISYDDIVYIPLATFNDIFLGGNGDQFAYNGKDFYYTAGFNGDDMWGEDIDSTTLEGQFYNDSPWKNQTTRSQTIATFNYNELCLSLDYYYGLKAFRGVNSFDELFTSQGYKTNLLSTNTNTYETAMASFAGAWLFEGHSAYSKVSPYQVGNSNLNTSWVNGVLSNSKYTALYTNGRTPLSSARNSAGKTVGVSFSGNTAIITFDSFTKQSAGLVNYLPVLDQFTYAQLHGFDSELFFHKAFNEIQARGTSISNVVLDLTLNGGGAVNALPWLLGYLTTDPYIRVETAVTGEISEVHYNVDLDRDGVYGGTYDTFGDKYNIFVMTSSFSFSCGNAFPTFVKDGHMATIIGETSGGGACCVGHMSTFCGTMLQTSSMFRFTYKNASNNWILNEGGITPDYTFSRSNFYNDAQINTFVNSL